MKQLTTTQKYMLENWIELAEKTKLIPSEIKSIDEKLSAVVQSLEYTKPIYFPRIIDGLA